MRFVPPGHLEKKVSCFLFSKQCQLLCFMVGVCFKAPCLCFQIAFVVGDSHWRGVVDQDVAIPQVPFSFSFLSVPGGGAADLRTELSHLDFAWTPDVVCVCAPGNDLTGSRTISDASVDFEALLTTACGRFSKVCSYLKSRYVCVCIF